MFTQMIGHSCVNEGFATLAHLRDHPKRLIIGQNNCHLVGCNETFICEPLLKNHSLYVFIQIVCFRVIGTDVNIRQTQPIN